MRFELSVVNGWFIREFARAFVSVGGVEHEVVWRRETVIAATPGATNVAVYFRYRGSRTALGTGTCRVDVASGETVHLVARNGVLNQTPFTVAPAS
jgi:hypothetical protein